MRTSPVSETASFQTCTRLQSERGITMKPRDSVLRAARRILSVFVLVAGAMCPVAESAAKNLLRNGDFERGEKYWTLADSQGNPGGAWPPRQTSTGQPVRPGVGR